MITHDALLISWFFFTYKVRQVQGEHANETQRGPRQPLETAASHGLTFVFKCSIVKRCHDLSVNLLLHLLNNQKSQDKKIIQLHHDNKIVGKLLKWKFQKFSMSFLP